MRAPFLSRSEASPVREFAISSLMVITFITVVLCVAISYLIRRELLEREWDTTAQFVRFEALENLKPEDFWHPNTPEARERFRAFYNDTIKMPEVVRVKVYDAKATVIWSDEPRLIGAEFPDNDELRRALHGTTVVNMEATENKRENVFEREAPELVELYVPIHFPDDARIIGVAETYKNPSKVFADIRRAQMTTIGLAVAGAALLHLALLWVMRRADRRIRKQNEELRDVHARLVGTERLAAIGEVAGAVAHGIRNPLANIRASAQVALLDCRECGSAVAPTSLRNVIGEVDRLEHQMREFLRLVRPVERRSDMIDVNVLVRASRDLLKERLRSADLEVEERLAPRLPAVIGDAVLLEQVFVNLLSNAVEALPDGAGRITVETGVVREGAVVAVFVDVTDTGAGIEAERLATIFELFHTTKERGTGLGLPLAKKFAEAHGGTITVRSDPGRGATFRVTLPLPGQG